MIESNQFGSQFGSQTPRAGVDAKVCAQYEAMLADVVDGLLTPEELAKFDEHASGCTSCGVQLAEAQRGAAWLSMLKAYPPEPDSALVTRILAETSVRTAGEQEALRAEQRAHAEQVSLLGSSLRLPVAGPVTRSPAVATVGSGVLPFRARAGLRLRPITHTILQPRFMMTAAMAFFSIALTLNVAGIRLNEIHASDLKPASLRRSFFQANAHVVRYYDNLRVVYELESRVHDLQHTSDDSGPASTYPTVAPGGTPDPKQGNGSPGGKSKPSEPDGKKPDGLTSQPAPNPKSGSSRREYPSPRFTQVAYAGETWLPGATALDPTVTWDAQSKFGRAL